MRTALLEEMIAVAEESSPPSDKLTQARSTLQRHWASIQRMGDPMRVLIDRLGTAINHNSPSSQDAHSMEDMVSEIEASNAAFSASVANLKRALETYKKAVAP